MKSERNNFDQIDEQDVRFSLLSIFLTVNKLNHFVVKLLNEVAQILLILILHVDLQYVLDSFSELELDNRDVPEILKYCFEVGQSYQLIVFENAKFLNPMQNVFRVG